MNKDFDIITLTFLFNIFTIIIFSLIYSSISPHNFEAMSPNDKLSYIDYLFYSVTIQCGVGLPDITAVTDFAKILAMIQQIILMGSAFILLQLFIKK
jgi:hypothetical protein